MHAAERHARYISCTMNPQTMKFDYEGSRDSIPYGVIRGGEKIVFIKSGLGGSYVGYENKYLKIALQLKKKYGCSVIVASNPHDGRNHICIDKQILDNFLAEHRICSPEFYFFGNSNGGIKGLELTTAGVVFQKMILVNMPLMINLHKTRKYISAIPQTEILAVYGTRDPSFSYIPFLDKRFPNVKIVTAEHADHNFKGQSDDFIRLSDRLMTDT